MLLHSHHIRAEFRCKENKYSTLGELSCGVSELKPKIKLDSWPSPFCGFHEIHAVKHEAFPTTETESITF